MCAAEQRQRPLDPAHLPHGAMPVSGKLGERIAGAERFEIAPVERRALGKIGNIGKSAAPRVRRADGCAPSRDSCLTSRNPRRSAGRPSSRRSSVQSQSLAATATATDLDAVRTRIAHQLRGRVKAHRLTVDERGAKGRRLVALQPGGGVDQQREARA